MHRMQLSALVAVALCASPCAGAPAAAENLVQNPGFERDEDGDGHPDGWFAAGSKTHPANWHCQRAKGKALLSPDAHSGRSSLCYATAKPNAWRPEPTDHTWNFAAWHAARQNPRTRFYYSAPVVSKEFRITYPKVYRVSAWVKAENIAGLHVKFIGVSSKGQPAWFPPALRTPEGLTGKTGTWGWEKWSKPIIANRGLGWKGRIEVWLRENQTEGKFWIDDVTVEEVDHAGRGLQSMPRGALWPRKAKPHTQLQGIIAKGEAIVVQERKPERLTVKQVDGSIVIWFPNGTTVVFNTTDADNQLGIGGVSRGRLDLRRATPAIRPLVETVSGGRYSACRYMGCEQKPDHVIIKTQLLEEKTGKADRLDWILAPFELQVYNRKYVGFSYSYRFESERNLACGIWDRATWEIARDVEGLHLRGPGGPRAPAVALAMAFQGRPSIPMLRTPCFDFQARGNTGILLGFFDGLGHVETWVEKRPGENSIAYLTRHYFTADKRVQSVPRCIVFARCGELAPLKCEDEHTWAMDVIERRYRAAVGLRDMPLLPSARLHMHSAKDGKFVNYIPLLSEIKRLGFQVVMLNPMWESLDRQGRPKPGTCSITGLDVAEAFGGEAGLKKLADAVHAQGMKLITWAPTGLNRHDSALLREHPDWICRLQDGQPRAYGSPGSYAPGKALTYVSLRSGYMEYSLARYRHFREAIGLNGFWQDSFHAIEQLHYTSPQSFTSSLVAGAKRQVALQRMGYEVLNIEGFGPFGHDSTSPRVLAVGDRRLYRTSIYYYLGLGPDTYYRAVANHAMPILPFHPSKHPYHLNRNVAMNPYLQAEVAQANRDYMAVRHKMKRRFLIPSKTSPWQEVGVLWRNEQPDEEVIFAYGTFEWKVEATQSVTDVTTGKPVALEDRAFTALPKHTYLIRE